MTRSAFLRVGLIVVAAAAATSTSGCRKMPVEAPLVWARSVDEAFAQGRAERKPVIVYFGAEWDTSWKEIEHRTLADAGVRARLQGFVNVYIDVTDDEAPGVRAMADRFRMVGEPQMIFHTSDGTEIFRFNEFVEPRRYEATLVAIRDARTREEAEDRIDETPEAAVESARLQKWRRATEVWTRDQAERKAILCARDPKRALCTQG